MDDSFQWTTVKKHRVLRLKDGSGPYIQQIYREEDLTQEIMPVLRGQPLEELPFVFVNGKDLMPEPDLPPFPPGVPIGAQSGGRGPTIRFEKTTHARSRSCRLPSDLIADASAKSCF